MSRKPISTVKRVRIFEINNGICHLCGEKIGQFKRELWDVEHVTPLSMGGTNDDDNLRPAHKNCHANKTAGESTVRAKADRARAKHLGLDHKRKYQWPKRAFGR